PAHDHAHCVIEIGMPHFGFEAYRKGFFGELLHRGRCSLSVKRLQSGVLAHVCKGTAESCCRGDRSLPGAQALKTNNFIMTVVLLRHLPSSCCKNRNTAWQGQNPHAIVGWKSPFSTATKKHCRQAENERANLNNSSQRGESDETSSDCNHRDRRDCRHAGLRGVWPGKPAKQRLRPVWLWHPCQQCMAQRFLWRQARHQRHALLAHRLLDSGDGGRGVRSRPRSQARTAGGTCCYTATGTGSRTCSGTGASADRAEDHAGSQSFVRF